VPFKQFYLGNTSKKLNWFAW